MNFSYSFQQGEYILKIYICVNNNIAEQHGSAVATSVVSQQENHMFGPKFLPQSSNMNFSSVINNKKEPELNWSLIKVCTVMSGNSLFNFLNFLFLILFFGAPHLLMTSRSVSPLTVQVYGYLSVYIQGVPCISPCVTCDQLPSKAVNRSIDFSSNLFSQHETQDVLYITEHDWRGSLTSFKHLINDLKS